MKLKKFDDTNIENPVNNARNLKYILQNNDLCQKHHRNKDGETIYNNTKCTHSITLTQLQERIKEVQMHKKYQHHWKKGIKDMKMQKKL